MKKIIMLIIFSLMLITGCEKEGGEMVKDNRVDINKMGGSDIEELYLAGGCFWGVEGYFDKLDGIGETEVGYANGKTVETSYQELPYTDHVEVLRLKYDKNKISLTEIIDHFFRIVDPTSLNRQGNDVGRQYRTGIYSESEETLARVREMIDSKRADYDKEVVVEVEPLVNYVTAEEYHQKYLQKNPGGYCHIDLDLADKPLYQEYKPKTDEELKEELDEISYDVTQKGGTERPFSSPLDNFYEKGIYVDKTTGEPLFSSRDKYDAGCGWPSFTRPITSYSIDYKDDNSLARYRVEVKSKTGDAHLGHVFEDGPVDEGGLRYCINGAALDFVPYEEMEERGYGDYIKYLED